MVVREDNGQRVIDEMPGHGGKERGSDDNTVCGRNWLAIAVRTLQPNFYQSGNDTKKIN
jgi:hypothetical protein